jgi:hypothetical protein
LFSSKRTRPRSRSPSLDFSNDDRRALEAPAAPCFPLRLRQPDGTRRHGIAAPASIQASRWDHPGATSRELSLAAVDLASAVADGRSGVATVRTIEVATIGESTGPRRRRRSCCVDGARPYS